MKKIIAFLLFAVVFVLLALPMRAFPEPERYDGFAAYLRQTDALTAEVIVQTDIDCGLQAFDIYLNVTDYEADSQYDLILGEGHFIAIGFETEMKQSEEYVVATLKFAEKESKYNVSIVRADFAIAHTPYAPKVDEKCYERYITIGR